MARPSKRLRHNILIVCEGESTEPQYFANLIPLAKTAWSETHDLYIVLSPKPTLVEEEKEESVSKHKTPRKRRQIKQIAEEAPPIEEPYKAVPVRYVREAQQGLEDNTYEETWAVFDKDDHPKHKEAFDLAEKKVEGKKVKIAFSSISFEQWVLLHFEKSLTAFEKSACKDGKKPIYCGTNQHPNDCAGKRCVSGYIKMKKYLNNYSKSGNAAYFDTLHPNFLSALENAAWLRHQILKANPSALIYQLNPYTNLDVLVKYLLQIQEKIVWTDFAHKPNIPESANDDECIFTIRFEKKSATLTELQFTNHSNKSHLLLPNHLFVIKNRNKISLLDSKMLVDTRKTGVVALNTTDCEELKLNFLLYARENYRILIKL